MSSVKQVSARVAIFVAPILVSALGAGSAQAAIVTGSVTGTWDIGFGEVNQGDSFTANYSYNDALLTPFDNSAPGQYTDTGFSGPLLSLEISSGNYSHTFDFSNSNSSSSVRFEQFVLDPSQGSYYSKFFQVFGFDATAPGNNYLIANKQVEQFGSNPPNIFQGVLLNTSDTQGNTVTAAEAFSPKFTPDPTTAVPTPALLPGLIGMGLAALRKRKTEQKEAVEV